MPSTTPATWCSPLATSTARSWNAPRRAPARRATTIGAQQQPGPAVPEIEYVRTYARVAQIQLRSVLESLTEQVDRLGSLPQAPQEHVGRAAAGEGPTGAPDWAPSTTEPSTHQG